MQHCPNKFRISNHANFGLVDHGKISSTPGLLTLDGMDLSQKGKRALAQEPAGLLDRAWEERGDKARLALMGSGMECQNWRK